MVKVCQQQTVYKNWHKQHRCKLYGYTVLTVLFGNLGRKSYIFVGMTFQSIDRDTYIWSTTFKRCSISIRRILAIIILVALSFIFLILNHNVRHLHWNSLVFCHCLLVLCSNNACQNMLKNCGLTLGYCDIMHDKMIVSFHLPLIFLCTIPKFFVIIFFSFFFSPAVTLLSHHCDYTSDTKKQVHVFPLQSPEQLPVPQTAETRMAKMKKKISSPLLKRKNISSGEFDFSWVITL